MRSLICRGLRLELVAGLGMALAMPALALDADGSQALATQTTLSAETHDQSGRTQASIAVSVTGEDGQPAAGAVVINDGGKPLAGVALNAKGQASAVLGLVAGSHTLAAVYAGDGTHRSSASVTAAVSAQASGTPGFGISVAPVSLTLTAGQSGSVVVSVTPENSAALTAPMFVTLSCAGLPDQASCTFTPENVEILPSTTAAVTSSMTVQTQAASGNNAQTIRPGRPNSTPIAFAFLLPGALALGGIAWGARRRRWLSRFALVALVGLVATLGTTACNPRYQYLNHGPPTNLPTPAGVYTVGITAQSSNGITAITQNIPFALTVK